MGKYIDSERKNSYDDLSSAIKLSPTYGEAYAYRYLVDMRRNDTESANYDIGMANKYNPTAARMVVSMQEAHEQHMAEYNAERARSAMAMANAMVGLSMAAGNQYEMQPIPKP